MKTNLSKSLFAAAALSIVAPVLAEERPVRIKTDGMPSYLRERLQAKAQEGPTALIQYVNRTRMMGYQIRVEDIVVPHATVAAASASTEAPRAEQPASKREAVAVK